MSGSHLGKLLQMRLLVGFLGERAQFGWWPTAFYEASSRQFLEPVFSKTSRLAQYHGVVEAARRLHDEHLSVGSYDSILGPYLQGAKSVVIEDPYIRLQHQIQNFVRFCETVLKANTVKKIKLITGYDDKTQLADIGEKMEELKQSLLDFDVELEVKLNPNMHDREVRIDNGWVVKIGRGLDFYQKPGSWFEVGATDLSLRKCLETKVDVFRS